MPHAERGVRSFMLTCLADGRAGDDEADKNVAKGPEIVCKLSLDAVHAAVALRTNTTPVDEQSKVEQLVIRTAQQAANLSKLLARNVIGKPQNVSRWHRDIPTDTAAAENDVPDIALNCQIHVTFDNEWKSRYAVWHHMTYEDATSPIPTTKQRHVLETIHYRTVKENYELLKEDYTDI